MADNFANHPPSELSAPAKSAAAITASDATDITDTPRAIYVGGAGNIAAVMATGEVVTFTAVPAGTILPIRVKRINATNTTATAMVALY